MQQRKPDYEKLDPRQKEAVLSEVAFLVAIAGLRPQENPKRSPTK